MRLYDGSAAGYQDASKGENVYIEAANILIIGNEELEKKWQVVA